VPAVCLITTPLLAASWLEEREDGQGARPDLTFIDYRVKN
jgi:hypothetical protein